MSFQKRAVHFGGGNIGRGFVAEFLHNSGYYVTFADVVDPLVENLNKTKSYTVTEIGEDGEREFEITQYQAINSKTHGKELIEEIAKADTVTCAVGPGILKFIAQPVAEGIKQRTLDYPLAVIACENMVNGTDTWRGFIEGHLDDESKANLSKKARFANSAIDRIVPNQPAGAGLNVKIEKFYEWCVESPPFQNGGKQPEIKGIHYVDNLEPYIERKLFTVNTSHATCAYYAYNKGYKFIHEAMADKEIHDNVRAAIKETAALIVSKHSVDQKEQDDYVEAIVKRISNPALEDNVSRVGRAPLRKIGRKERFIGPAAQLAEQGKSTTALVNGVEQLLHFQNVPEDKESEDLAKILKESSAEEATTKLTGLESSHPLYKDILARVEKVQKESK